MCVDFRKINDLQPQVRRVDSATSGNISLVPLPKIDEMYAALRGAKIFMMKEAYAIYMTVKKSTFYLTGADITLRSDHLPLNKFLQRNTLNLHVNNWAVEIESFKIKFLHIAGKDNVIADTLSCLINIDPDIILEPELKDYEFGSYCFETLPKARSLSVTEKLASIDGVDVCEISITYDNDENSPNSVEMPLSD